MFWIQSLQYRLSVQSLMLATGCVLRSCGTMGIVRPTVLIVDDHEVFRASARALSVLVDHQLTPYERYRHPGSVQNNNDFSERTRGV